jgi:hypothetical protein
MAGRSEDSNVRGGKGSPEGEAGGRVPIYRASLAADVTVACLDHNGWSQLPLAPSSERTLTRRG